MSYAAANPNVTCFLRLAGGSRVLIRSTLANDLDLQREFFRSLSRQRRYFRFMTGFEELPPSLAELFASIDHRSHVALLAAVFDGGREIMVGEARYAIDPHDRSVCEFAIAVADDWALKGLASALLVRLEQQAIARGVRHMRAETLACNRAMIGLALSAGYKMNTNKDDPSLIRLEKQLFALPGGIRDAEAA